MIFDTYYIGYSLDTVMEAVAATTCGKRVKLLATGPLGSPLDTYGDMIGANYTMVLDALVPGLLNYTQYMNPRFYYIPYDKVKISNSSNGAIAYPISGRSFNSEDEWKRMCDAYNSEEVQKIVTDTSVAPSKLVTAVKNLFPAEFSDTFAKAMQNIRWRGIPLSQFSMLSFTYEFDMSHAAEKEYNEFFMKPDMSFAGICEALCNRYGIVVEQVSAEDVKRVITTRDSSYSAIVMDNRIDMYMDYMCGKLDRCRIWSTPVQVPQQLIHARDGLYYTPLSECWAVTIFDGVARKFMSEVINTLYDQGITEVPATKANLKMYSQYVDLLSHYGDRKMGLGQRIETMIK